MGTESQIEFHQRWVKTAEADLQSARHNWLIWTIAFFVVSIAYITSQFMPGLDRAKTVHLLLSIPFVILMIKAGISASYLHDARKFLRECRQGMATEIQSNLEHD